MKPIKTLILGGALIVCASLVAHIRNGASRSARIRVQSDNSNAEALRELKELRQSVLQTRAIALAAAQATQPTPAPSAPESSEPLAAAAPPRPPQTSREIEEHLELRHESQAVDRQWRYQASRLIEAQISKSLGVGARLLSVDCRSTICRAETSHASLESYKKFLQDAFVGMGNQWQGSTRASISGEEPDGQVRSTAYFLRAGETFEGS